MTWQPVDCHAHTTMSDGSLTVEQLVERARATGVRPSVSDHISRDVGQSIASIAAVRTYLDTLDRFDVLRGGEFCWHDQLWCELPADLASRFTHRLGSLHAVYLPDGSLIRSFTRRVPAELDVDVYMNAHIDNVVRLAAEMPVDILSHPTLVAVPFRDRDPHELFTEEREARAVGALREAGIAFEISNRYPPHERFVRRAVEAGVRISLGSDGHTADQVADIVAPLALARALGVADEELYDPARHGAKSAAAGGARA